MTLNDLERPNRTVAEKTFYGAHQKKNLNEDRPIISAAKCWQMILVSKSVCGYSLGFLGEGS